MKRAALSAPALSIAPGYAAASLELAGLEIAMGRHEAAEGLLFGLAERHAGWALIPRPETELLVEQAITWLRSRPAAHLAADVGTGSGCIAISLAVHAPHLKVIASDISLPALRVAHTNAARHAVDKRLFCVQSDMLPGTSRGFDLVCVNLPYIPSAELERLKVYRREPTLALDGGLDGLGAIRKLLHSLGRAIGR